jgi:hypothetical protein
LLIENNKIYHHQVLRSNYTTYDIRRNQDSINPRTHSDVMILADDEEDHPYWYARVVGIYSVSIRRAGPFVGWTSLDVLHVRHYDLVTRDSFGFGVKRLPGLVFADPTENPHAFGFISPQDIIRAVHLVPGFRFLRTSALLGPSIARRVEENDSDYSRYYVNMCVEDPHIYDKLTLFLQIC